MIDGTLVVDSTRGRRLHELARRLAADSRSSGVLSALAVAVAYLIVRPQSRDFSSGDFRARLFREHAYLWDNHWFGGHPLPGYGVVSPMLGAILGVVPVAIGSLMVASWAFGSIMVNLQRAHPNLPSPRIASSLFAIGCGISLWGGRLTFGPAVAFGVLCVLCLQRERFWLATLAALLCGLSSPVGAVSLAIALVAAWIVGAFPRKWLVVAGIVAVLPAAVLNLVFPEGGWYPFPGASFGLLCGCLAVIGWFGRKARFASALALVYSVVAIGAFLFRSPLGGNITRLAWMAAGPAAVLTVRRFRRTLLPMFVVFTVIWGWSYVSLGFASADQSADPAYYDSLATFIHNQTGGSIERVEVIPTDSFRQADELALKINIARGWEAQVDRQLNPEFYHDLSSTTFHAWLLRNSVSLVAVPLSGAVAISGVEREIIAANPSYLEAIWSTSQWQVYRVVDAVPLADNGATVTDVETESLTVDAPLAGVSTVRFRYTKMYHVTSGDGCVAESPDGWIELHVRTPGTIVATVSLDFGSADDCDPSTS